MNLSFITNIKHIVVFILALSLMSSFISDNYSTTITDSITLSITSDSSRVHLSSNLHRYISIEATITNLRSKRISFVLPGDGSDVGWRSPIVKWSVVPMIEDDHMQEQHDFQFSKMLRCGIVNSIKASDIVKLESGENIYIDEWIGYPEIPAKLGVYSVQLYFENDPKINWKDLAHHNKGLIKMAKATDPVVMYSNELIIEVVE